MNVEDLLLRHSCFIKVFEYSTFELFEIQIHPKFFYDINDYPIEEAANQILKELIKKHYIPINLIDIVYDGIKMDFVLLAPVLSFKYRILFEPM